ncbi:MAG: DUF2075 domain-containing protein [Acholeplasmataceae bacterium]|nr:DUF2075 domain-containing protein [Acholeplasmataceae bacterium]
MIIYENTINNFIIECNNNTISNNVLLGARTKGYNVAEKEYNSWENSLPFIAATLDDESIDQDINVAIEYKLDMTKSRMDFLIYGRGNDNKDSLVIVELKQWSEVKNSNKPNYVYAFGGGGAKDYEHPSYQSYRYKSILKGFNEYVQEENVTISSCSYLHNMDNIYEFVLNDKIKFPFIEKSPVFFKDDASKLQDFIRKYVKSSHRKLLYEIDNARIRPSSDFSNLMYDALKGQPIFTLDDEQQNSVATIVHETTSAIRHNNRRTIIIKGGPGTGKSIVAVNALGSLIHPQDGSKPYNVAYCTTNFTPRTLFSELLVGNDFKKSAIKELFKPIASFARSSEFDFDCILLDEAHRAFIWKFGQGVKRSVDLIDKLFYASRVNVFFIDEDQAVTKDDYLTIEKIKNYARKYNSEIIETDDLKLSSQFRCLGGQYYIGFIESLLGYNNHITKYYKNKNYDFKVVDTPSELWKLIQEKQLQYPKSRLLAGYTHDWVSQNDDDSYDFILENGKFKMRWNKKINISYINDNSQFDRIGCIHTIQGVDMQYAGVIIGKDLKYRNGQIVFDKTKNAKSDKASGIRNTTQEEAERLIRNTYKVLLTRAIYGTYVYCEDKPLNEYIKNFIK